MDHWQSINGSPHDATPIDLAEQVGDAVHSFLRIPSRRLVVTGDAGSGRTVLALRFSLAMLLHRRLPEDPLPVIFSLGGWDAAAVPLRGWMADVLHSDFPFLLEPDETGRTLASRLISSRRLLPVLDGFDELGEDSRGDAVRRINAAVGHGDGYCSPVGTTSTATPSSPRTS